MTIINHTITTIKSNDPFTKQTISTLSIHQFFFCQITFVLLNRIPCINRNITKHNTYGTIHIQTEVPMSHVIIHY